METSQSQARSLSYWYAVGLLFAVALTAYVLTLTY